MLLEDTRTSPSPKPAPDLRRRGWFPLPSPTGHASSKYKPTRRPYRWGDNWSWGAICSDWWEGQRLCLPAGKGLWCCARGLRKSRMLPWCPDGKAWTGRQSKKTVWNRVVRDAPVQACQHWGLWWLTLPGHRCLSNLSEGHVNLAFSATSLCLSCLPTGLSKGAYPIHILCWPGCHISCLWMVK